MHTAADPRLDSVPERVIEAVAPYIGPMPNRTSPLNEMWMCRQLPPLSAAMRPHFFFLVSEPVGLARSLSIWPLSL